jgi:hypothetical protein
MMFLIRTAFWLAVVIMLIPVDEDAAGRAEAAAPPIGAFEAVGAAQATLSDVGGFCARNPDVCSVGGRVATTFALKARTGAEMVSSFLDERLAETADGAAPAAELTAAERGTLTAEDLQPAWHGPDAKSSI